MNRRNFISRFGLGAAGALLSPTLNGFIAEAMGQPNARKLFFLYSFPVGFHADMEFSPQEFRGQGPTLEGKKAFTWPFALGPLEPFRNRALLIDGLSNDVKSNDGHSGGYGALTGVSHPDKVLVGKIPVGISIDQHIAKGFGTKTAVPSIRFGVQGRGWGPEGNHAFAFGKDSPAPHIGDPAKLHLSLFGQATGGGKSASKSQTLLLDTMASAYKRVANRLAGAERAKIDQTLAAIEQLERRMLAAGGCTVPSVPNSAFKTNARGASVAASSPEDALESMLDISLIAVICGLSNVVAISDGFGAHGTQTRYKRIHNDATINPNGFMKGEPEIFAPNHEPAVTAKPMREVVRRYQSSLLARAITTLQAVPFENGANLFDRSTMLFVSTNGDDHHARKTRWPCVVVGNAGGTLKADGRFLYYPGRRALSDLFSTLATAVGVPTNDFGKPGPGAVPNDPIQGPLTELL